MAFCSGCGTEVAADAAFCGSCGVGVGAAKVAAMALPPELPKAAGVAAAEVSDGWKKTFGLIEKAGGPKLPQAKGLKFGERSRVIFNVWGFLFGPIYYLVKGMWKRAITLTALCVVAIIVLSLILEAMGASDKITNLIAGAVFATRANVDFYKKMVLGDNGWW